MPPDHFATLGKPRRPWLELTELKNVFHRLTGETHPDRTGETEPSSALNTAYATLRDPALRLRHLLELEHPEALSGSAEVPAELANIFMRLATLRRAVDAFVDQQSTASTPLSQALLASERFALQRDTEKELAALEGAQAGSLERAQALDAIWPQRTAETVEELARVQRELTYFGKWHWQLREALFRLENGGSAA